FGRVVRNHARQQPQFAAGALDGASRGDAAFDHTSETQASPGNRAVTVYFATEHVDLGSCAEDCPTTTVTASGDITPPGTTSPPKRTIVGERAIRRAHVTAQTETVSTPIRTAVLIQGRKHIRGMPLVS